MVVQGCSPSYLEDWGRGIIWNQEFWDYSALWLCLGIATALQPVHIARPWLLKKVKNNNKLKVHLKYNGGKVMLLILCVPSLINWQNQPRALFWKSILWPSLGSVVRCTSVCHWCRHRAEQHSCQGLSISDLRGDRVSVFRELEYHWGKHDSF